MCIDLRRYSVYAQMGVFLRYGTCTLLFSGMEK